MDRLTLAVFHGFKVCAVLKVCAAIILIAIVLGA